MRGTHASVGVATRQAPIQAHGYIPLIGKDKVDPNLKGDICVLNILM